LKNNIPVMRNGVLRDLETSAPRSVQSVERALAPRYSAYLEEVRRLMKAGLAVMQSKGSVDPRVSEIVREAGLSNQVFYRHFKGKDELLLAILDEGTRTLVSYLEHRMDGASTAIERVRAWVEGVVTQATNPAGAYASRPFASHQGRLSERFPDEITTLAGLLSEPLLGALADARDAGELPGIDPERDAEAIYQLAVGWLQRRLVTGNVPSDEDAAHIVSFALNALQSRPSGRERSATA
jgi:AcrR family transcriptional regulator